MEYPIDLLVRVADDKLQEFTIDIGPALEALSKLPSQFQNGDQVTLNFYDAGKVINCEVIKVHFTDRKVLYDVEVMMNGDDAEVTTRLYNIDSCLVEPADGTNS